MSRGEKISDRCPPRVRLDLANDERHVRATHPQLANQSVACKTQTARLHTGRDCKVHHSKCELPHTHEIRVPA